MTKEKKEQTWVPSATLAMLEMREVAKKYGVNWYFVVSKTDEQKIHSGSFAEVLSFRKWMDAAAVWADLVSQYLHLSHLLMEAMWKFWLMNIEMAWEDNSRKAMEVVDSAVAESLKEMIDAIQTGWGMITAMVHKSNEISEYDQDGKSFLDEIKKDDRTKQLSEKNFPPAVINRMRQIANAITGKYYEPIQK